jgi:hypothetical protein
LTKEFLLHKDKKEKEIPPLIQAQLVPIWRDLALPFTKANASQMQSIHEHLTK